MSRSDLHAPGPTPLLTTYGVRSSDGTLKAVVFNKNADLTLDAGQRVQGAEMVRLTGPSLEDTQGVTLGGAEVSAGGVWVAQHVEHMSARDGKVLCHIPAASAAMVSLG